MMRASLQLSKSRFCDERKDVSCNCSNVDVSKVAKVQRVNRDGVVFSGSRQTLGLWLERAGQLISTNRFRVDTVEHEITWSML